MTTPNERRRNLGWTRSTLQEVADAAADGSLLRQRARQLLETAPSILDIEGLNTASPDQVSAVINCIEAARELFRTALRELDEPVICRGLKVTLRHYPEPSDFGFWRQLAGRGVPMGSVILNDVEGAVARKRGEVWLAENREPLESSNAFVEAHGLPLARHRKF